MDNFEAEALGLTSLAETGAIKLPNVIGVSSTEQNAFLVLEWIETGRRPIDYSSDVGQEIAQLHLASQCNRFGFETDNFIGATAQQNGWSDKWIEFWIHNRMLPQLEMAGRAGFSQIRKLGGRFCERLPDVLRTDLSQPVLLHGDLWSGNYLFDNFGQPVLIDPAVYFGHAEAEFGMTSLFGGFDDSFYEAYNEVNPLEPGWRERVEIYRLYHLLNHLNLFGSSYLSGCLTILKKYN